MPRYVDADAMMRLIPTEESVARMVIANVPAADVVEVVRCKDCVHNPENYDDDLCPFVESDGHIEYFPPEDFYCALGERREE